MIKNQQSKISNQKSKSNDFLRRKLPKSDIPPYRQLR